MWRKQCWLRSFERTHLQTVIPCAFLVILQKQLGSCSSPVKYRTTQMLLWDFLICIPISGKQLYLTFSRESSHIACSSLGTGVLSWSLPMDSQVEWPFLGARGAVLWIEAHRLALFLSSPSCHALSWDFLSTSLPVPGEVSVGSLQNCCFSSPVHSCGGLWGCCYVPKETGLLVFFHYIALVLLCSSDGRWAFLSLTASGCIHRCSLKYIYEPLPMKAVVASNRADG